MTFDTILIIAGREMAVQLIKNNAPIKTAHQVSIKITIE
jgi:hypothetical protein